jgi:hypothetical protein
MPLSIEAQASDKRPKAGMTLDEMEAFIARARKLGASGREHVDIVTVGWTKPRIKTARVSIADAE